MASPLRHKVEGLFGWLFVITVVAALAAVVHFATKPRLKVAESLPQTEVTKPQSGP
jgi:hypothetical protein